MAPPIRELLARAQRAELDRDVPTAVALLTEAAEAYRAQGQAAQAARMRRQIERLEAAAPAEPGDEDLGFGDALAPSGGARALEARERGPALADPSLEAWCSFCCRPKTEVGALVAGPAGAFVCRGCVGVAVVLYGGAATPGPAPVPRAARPPPQAPELLPAQAAVLARWRRGDVRLALLVGPSGAGKTVVARAAAPVVAALHEAAPDADALAVELEAPLSEADGGALLRWLGGAAERRLLLVTRGAPVAPLVVLEGDDGPWPVFGTPALVEAYGQVVPASLLGRVDAVWWLEAPPASALEVLARRLVAERGVRLSDDALATLVKHAEASGRGAHELVALLQRIPPGRYR